MADQKACVYTEEETRDMIKCYFASGCINTKARRMYGKLFPYRICPSQQTIYRHVMRSHEDPNIDMNQFTMEDPRDFFFKGGRKPIVYTKRLDEMKIFKKDIKELSYKTLFKCIRKESKPKLRMQKLKDRVTRPRRSLASFNEMKLKLDSVQEKIYVISDDDSDDVAILTYECPTAGRGSIPETEHIPNSVQEKISAISHDDSGDVAISTDRCPTAERGSTPKSDVDTQEKIEDKLLESLKDAVQNDYGLNADKRKLSKNNKNAGAIKEKNHEVDIMNVAPENDLLKLVKNSTATKRETTLNMDEKGFEIFKNSEKVNTPTSSGNIQLYWRVYLAFICQYANLNYLYYIDRDGTVTDYARISINENYDISDLNKYVGPVKTVVFRCCCWYKRHEFITLLRSIPRPSVTFMSTPHNCTPSGCVCCCRPKKKLISKAATSSMPTIYDEDKEISLLDQEITNALLKTKDKHEQRKRWFVEGINKWLQELQKTQDYSKGIMTLINKGLIMKMKSEAIHSLHSQKILSNSTKAPKNEWNSGHVVVHILNERSKHIHVYEIFQGIPISTASVVGFNKNLRDLTFFLANKLLDSYDHLADMNVMRKFQIPCCWYFREALIKYRSSSSSQSALNFMRQPHCCPAGLCMCCCRFKTERFIIGRASNENLWQDVYKTPKCGRPAKRQITRTCEDDTTQIDETPKAIKLTNQTNQIPSTPKWLEVEVLPGTKTLSAKIVPVKKQTSQLSMLDNDIIECDDDEMTECTPSSPLPSPSPPIVPDSIPTSDLQLPEEPSSKITLFSSDMACTITTYSLAEKEPTELLDAGDDPLGMSVDQNNADSVSSDPLNLDGSPVNTVDEERDPLSFEETFKIEETPTETIDDATDPLDVDIVEKTDQDVVVTEPHISKKPSQRTYKEPPQNLNVELLISTILDRFRDVRLYINDEGNVTADLNAPVSSLKTAELKVLANILAHAQEQVKSMSLRPGTILNGQFGMAGHLDRNLNPDDPESPLYATENCMEPNSTSPVTSFQDGLPRIENVFSLTDGAHTLIESSHGSNSQTNQISKIRVRPPEQLRVPDTTMKPTPLLQNMLNTQNVLLPPIPDYPLFLPVHNNISNIMPRIAAGTSQSHSNVTIVSNVESLAQNNASNSSHALLPDIVTSSIQTSLNPLLVEISTQTTKPTKGSAAKVNKKRTNQNKIPTKRGQTSNRRNKKVVQVSDILKSGRSSLPQSADSTKNVSVFDVIEIEDD